MYAMLNTKTTMNPNDPLSAEYGEEGQVVYVLEDPSDKLRCFTSFGSLNLFVGDEVESVNDLTCRRMRPMRVVGISYELVGGGLMGSVPNRKLPHWVAK